MIKTILFDLDGTLVDTELAAAEAIRACFREWKIDITKEDAAYITGRTWASAFKYLFDKYPIPIAVEAAAALMMERYRAALLTHLVIVPGAAACVEDLAKEFDLALVSGSNRQEILFALDKLKIRQHFKVILGAEDYGQSKPSPEGYLKAMKMMGSDPAHTLCFEDSEPGIASAIAAGVRVVAIEGTNHHMHDNKKAHRHVTDLSGVNRDWVHQHFSVKR